MNKILTYFAFILALAMPGSAMSEKVLDNGRDTNDNFIVSETLALRCGVSSKNPAITEECIRRLAYDYKSGRPPAFENYSDERRAIISEYTNAYMLKAISQMIAGGDYGDHIDELIKEDPTQTYELNNDTREKMEFSNKLVSDNTSLFLRTIDLRASQINFDNINTILDVLVPATDIDLENDKYLALPPSE